MPSIREKLPESNIGCDHEIFFNRMGITLGVPIDVDSKSKENKILVPNNPHIFYADKIILDLLEHSEGKTENRQTTLQGGYGYTYGWCST